MKKNILLASLIAGMVVSVTYAVTPSASALTVGDLQAQVQTLLAQIADLKAHMNATAGQTTGTTIAAGGIVSSPHQYRICTLINRNLSAGTHGDDVTSLQEFLSGQGYFTANTTGYFGPLTASALARWQTSQNISSVGALGPLTRARIIAWCGNPSPTPTPSCKPINYMAVLCPDGTAPQPKHNESGCITGYECPVANFTPPANCKAWNDGCNECARTTPNAPAACTMRACFAAGKGYCSTYFDDTSSGGNHAPTISSFSGPTSLSLNQTGTWTIQASDPDNQALSYHVVWGDENTPYSLSANANANISFTQTTSFTHSYYAAGTYTVTVVVQDTSGQSATGTMTVHVGNDSACTTDYVPVCGQPAEPACRHSNPACMIATPGPQTYSNRCQLDAAGATFLYSGQCTTNPVACAADAMLCPNGSYVGRTGPNCQFVCPSI